MILLETTQKYRAESEEQAKEMMQSFRDAAFEKGYTIKKSGYEYKSKKSKGEIVDEGYLVTIVMTFGSFWE